MHWRIQWDYLNYRMPIGNPDVYTYLDFLEIRTSNLPVDERKLNYTFGSTDNGIAEPEGKPIPDFPTWLTPGVIICKSEVWSFFSGLKFGWLKTYMGDIDGQKYLFHCCLTEMAAFDFKRSKYRMNGETIAQIFFLKLVDGFSSEIDVFRLNDNRGCRSEMIVSDKFKKIYNENSLTGLLFHPA